VLLTLEDSTTADRLKEVIYPYNIAFLNLRQSMMNQTLRSLLLIGVLTFRLSGAPAEQIYDLTSANLQEPPVQRPKTPRMTNEDLPTRHEKQNNDGLQRTDIFKGGEVKNLLCIDVSLPSQAYSEPQQCRAFVQRVLGRIQALSQVESAAIFGALPDGRYGESTSPALEALMTKDLHVSYNLVTRDYFRVVGLPLLSGRSFTEQDQSSSQGVIILSASLARTLFPNADPIGKQVSFPLGSSGNPWKEVVGVVLDAQDPPERGKAELYVPYSQAPATAIKIVVRGKTQIKGLSEKLTSVIHEIDSQVVISNVQQ
jgi:hypothetical protein